MKYNFFHIVTALVFVFTAAAAEVKDSVSAAGVSTAPFDGGLPNSAAAAGGADTALTLSGVTSDSGIVKSEEEFAHRQLVIDTIFEAAEEVADRPQPLITPMEETAAAQAPVSEISEKALSSVQENAAESAVNIKNDAKKSFTENKTARWFSANIFYILFFCGSLALILAALFFFSTKKDARRFLTTTRLSVLDKMVQRGCRYIESNYMDPQLTVEAVCRELVTGEAYMDALFVKEIGIGVQDFITQVRVNSIKNLLAENPALELDKVCVQCGFKNMAEANAHFVKLSGAGIEEYRRSLPRPA